MTEYLDKSILTEEDRRLLDTAIEAGLVYADLGKRGRTVLQVSFGEMEVSTHRASYENNEWKWKALEE